MIDMIFYSYLLPAAIACLYFYMFFDQYADTMINDGIVTSDITVLVYCLFIAFCPVINVIYLCFILYLIIRK
jgi:hypothetical protein